MVIPEELGKTGFENGQKESLDVFVSSETPLQSKYSRSSLHCVCICRLSDFDYEQSKIQILIIPRSRTTHNSISFRISLNRLSQNSLSSHFDKLQRLMELSYPSRKLASNDLNLKTDQICSKITITTKHFERPQHFSKGRKHTAIPHKVNQKMHRYLYTDNLWKLYRLIDDQAVPLTQQLQWLSREVLALDSKHAQAKQNYFRQQRISRFKDSSLSPSTYPKVTLMEKTLCSLIHIACLTNSPQVLKFLLISVYQTYGFEEYLEMVNERILGGIHLEGATQSCHSNTHTYTPLTLCICNRSDECLEVLLEMGGVDLGFVDDRRHTPYEIALLQQNSQALQLIMQYDCGGRQQSQGGDAKSLKSLKSISKSNKHLPNATKKFIASKGFYINESSLNNAEAVEILIKQSKLSSSPYENSFWTTCFPEDQSVWEVVLQCFVCEKQMIEDFEEALEADPKKAPPNHSAAKASARPECSKNGLSLLERTFNQSLLGRLWPQASQGQKKLSVDELKIWKDQRQRTSGVQISWKPISSLPDQKDLLFDCFQPYDIVPGELSKSLGSNSLIILQCLSEHPWLVRRIVKPKKSQEGETADKGQSCTPSLPPKASKVFEQSEDESRQPKKYSVNLFLKDKLQELTVDENVPCEKYTEEALFCHSRSELWPALVEKALAKSFGSYETLQATHPVSVLESLTGAFVTEIALAEHSSHISLGQPQIEGLSIFKVLQEFSSQGYLLLVKGRPGAKLCSEKQNKNLFTILNFYEKGSRRLILVNCPEIVPDFEHKQRQPMRQLELIKSHYSSQSQMCVWVDEDRFGHYFQSFIVAVAEPNSHKTTHRIRIPITLKDKSEPITLGDFGEIPHSTNSIKSEGVISVSRKSATHSLERSIGQLSKEQCSMYRKTVFFKFSCKSSNSSEGICFCFKSKDGRYCKTQRFEGWIDEGREKVEMMEVNSLFKGQLVKLSPKPGYYLCKAQICFQRSEHEAKANQFSENSILSKTKSFIASKVSELSGSKRDIGQNSVHSFDNGNSRDRFEDVLIVSWAENSVQPENIEPQFATIEWLDFWKAHNIRNWTLMEHKSRNGISFEVESITDRVIILSKSIKPLLLTLNFPKQDQKMGEKANFEDSIFEGKIVNKEFQKDESSSIELAIEFGVEAGHSGFQSVVLGSGDFPFIECFSAQQHSRSVQESHGFSIRMKSSQQQQF